MSYLTLHEGSWAEKMIAIVAFPILGGQMILFERRDNEYGREASMWAWLAGFVENNRT